MARRMVPVYISLILLFASAFLLSLMLGSVDISIPKALAGEGVDALILFSIRLPRTLAALLAGLAFALSGVLVQCASGNELASGNIIGLNSGAGFFVLLTLAFAPQHFSILPFAAFLGALVAVTLVFAISSLVTVMNSGTALILSGVAVNALFNGAISSLSALRSEVLSTYSSFSVGGFAMVTGEQLKVPAILISAAALATLCTSPVMDVMALGDEMASSLGYKVRRVRMLLIALSSLLAASAVTFCGLLGFVGLVTPHMARRLGGGKARTTVLLSMLIGPILVILADTLARTLLSPSELPAGVFMAAIGVPFFIALLVGRRR